MFETNLYKDKVRIKKQKLDWLKENRDKGKNQSVAAFLDQILEDYIKPNLFKQKKK